MGETPLERRLRELQREDEQRQRAPFEHPLVVEYMPQFVGLYLEFMAFCIDKVPPRHYAVGPAPAVTPGRRWRSHQPSPARPSRPCWPLVAQVTGRYYSSAYDETGEPEEVRALVAVDASTIATGAFKSIRNAGKPLGSIERVLPAEQPLRDAFLPPLVYYANTESHWVGNLGGSIVAATGQHRDARDTSGRMVYVSNREALDFVFAHVERSILRYVESRQAPSFTGISNPLGDWLPGAGVLRF